MYYIMTSHKRMLLQLPSAGTQFTIDGPLASLESAFTGYNISKFKISQLKFFNPEAGHHILTVHFEGDPALIDFNRDQNYDGVTLPSTATNHFKAFLLSSEANKEFFYKNDTIDTWDFIDPKQQNVLKQLTIYVKIDGVDTPLITPDNRLYMEIEFE